MHHTISLLNDGRVELNVFTGGGWVTHVFQDAETMDKYINRVIKHERPIEENIPD